MLLRKIVRMEQRLHRVESFLLTATFLLLLLLAFMQVMLRNVFDSGFVWADILNRLLVLWITMFAASMAVTEDKHLSLEILTKFLPERYLPYVRLAKALFVMVVCLILMRSGYLFYLDQMEFEATDYLVGTLPKAYFSLAFPFGFGLIAFHSFINLFKAFERTSTEANV